VFGPSELATGTTLVKDHHGLAELLLGNRSEDAHRCRWSRRRRRRRSVLEAARADAPAEGGMLLLGIGLCLSAGRTQWPDVSGRN
jgi:hypothetical protein